MNRTNRIHTFDKILHSIYIYVHRKNLTSRQIFVSFFSYFYFFIFLFFFPPLLFKFKTGTAHVSLLFSV